MMPDTIWSRIPIPIESEQDRRTMTAILASVGLEVRVVKERSTPSSSYKRYIEYKVQSTYHIQA